MTTTMLLMKLLLIVDVMPSMPLALREVVCCREREEEQEEENQVQQEGTQMKTKIETRMERAER